MKNMIKMLWIILVIGFSTPLLASSDGDIGTVVGGIAGGLIGNNMGQGSGRTVSTIGGAVIGSLVGRQVANASERPCCYTPCHREVYWESAQRPCPPCYRHTFIGADGRLCRRSVLSNEYGDRIYATYCCYRMSPYGYCSVWHRVS